VSAIEAVSLIRDDDTVATGGFVGIGFAEDIAIALEELFVSTDEQYVQALGKPRNPTLEELAPSVKAPLAVEKLRTAVEDWTGFVLSPDPGPDRSR
jgi:hypothetical protein